MENNDNKKEKVVNEVFSKEDIEENKSMAIIAYILFFIPYLSAKDSKFAMYHAKQGLGLFLLALAGWFVIRLFWIMFTWSMLGFLGLLANVWYLGIMALAIVGIINAFQGEAKELPIVGKLVKKYL